MTMVDNEYPVLEFTAGDRCDACGVAAHTLASHFDLGELLFCSHHIIKHGENLLDEGWVLVSDAEAQEYFDKRAYKIPV